MNILDRILKELKWIVPRINVYCFQWLGGFNIDISWRNYEKKNSKPDQNKTEFSIWKLKKKEVNRKVNRPLSTQKWSSFAGVPCKLDVGILLMATLFQHLGHPSPDWHCCLWSHQTLLLSHTCKQSTAWIIDQNIWQMQKLFKLHFTTFWIIPSLFNIKWRLILCHLNKKSKQ